MNNEPLKAGYYNKSGNWVRTKMCFISCGDLCDCGPPNGKWQLSPEEIKTLNHEQPIEEEV